MRALTVLACGAGAAMAFAGTLLVSPGLRQTLAARLPPTWHAALSAWRHGVTADHGLRLKMPDGVEIATSLYQPKNADGPRATVLLRTPYRRLAQQEATSFAIYFAARGYAAVVQDLRGTGESGGRLLPWAHARDDGVATLDWIAAQPWSNGRVGTLGCSALGETQLVLAAANHPAHRAMIPTGAGGGIGSAAGRYSPFGVFEGGVPQLASAFGWFVGNGAMDRPAPPAAAFDLRTHLKTLPVSTLVSRVRPGANGFADYFATPLGDPRWTAWGYVSETDRPRVPSLLVNTWGDQTVGDTLAYAQWLRDREPAAAEQKVFIAPGAHCGHADRESLERFGEIDVQGAAQPWNDIYLAWFDRWLRGRGEGLDAYRAFNVFIVGENRWLGTDAWPPPESRTERWHLGSGGDARSAGGNGSLSRVGPDRHGTDSFDYDPANPVPTRGGPMCCTGLDGEPNGPTDQSEVESRRDVLVYTSAPLESDLRIVGPLAARLTLSSSAPDTDFVVRLAHVRPNGRSLSIQEGALRLRYREGFAAPAFMKPGERYAVRVDLRSIAYRVPKGDRLRVHVTSSSFPRLERNLNTGAPNNADETKFAVASNRVHHGPGAESYIEMHVLPPPANLQNPTRGS